MIRALEKKCIVNFFKVKQKFDWKLKKEERLIYKRNKKY